MKYSYLLASIAICFNAHCQTKRVEQVERDSRFDIIKNFIEDPEKNKVYCEIFDSLIVDALFTYSRNDLGRIRLDNYYRKAREAEDFDKKNYTGVRDGEEKKYLCDLRSYELLRKSTAFFNMCNSDLIHRLLDSINVTKNYHYRTLLGHAIKNVETDTIIKIYNQLLNDIYEIEILDLSYRFNYEHKIYYYKYLNNALIQNKNNLSYVESLLDRVINDNDFLYCENMGEIAKLGSQILSNHSKSHSLVFKLSKYYNSK
ncbi:MAG TPA: hypothetical protein PKD32_09640 [Saprospiraceae bacterium]|mgnify:CR=1 FL=1|nr:hypothetical protein [Saprospiraceae bacterium]